MYQFVAIISAIIRYYLPNPYLSWITNQVYADLFNIIVGGLVLHKLSFWLSGCSYYKGINDPSKGSFGYLTSYILLTFIITIIGKLEINYKMEIVIFALIYLLLCILTSKLFRNEKIKL